ncbi:50S ribosomal protein L18 [Zostera marina]|uniref:50S ribosomal protein L18 n=1 Tax=Zostera marina TaxID=29655 RepID=A0A0K9NY11_ZOSMR|nr:50S ribosomal protein L18 [Zostera marina]
MVLPFGDWRKEGMLCSGFTEVVHTPTTTVAVASSSQEKLLKPNMGNTRDVEAARKIGKLLAERLHLLNIPAVTVCLNGDQVYHGKVKAVIDNVRNSGVKLI